MIFILSCATDDAVYQVSDRRLVWLGGSAPGSVKDDQSNKAVLVDGRMAFGYTGIAEINGAGGDYWLASLFGNQSTSDLAVVAERIRAEATREFKRMSVPDRRWLRHAFVGVGWATYRGESAVLPMLVTVTNALDASGEWEVAPSPEFRMLLNRWGATAAGFSIAFAGQSLIDGEKKAIWRHVRRVVRRGAPRLAMLRALIDSCMWIASRHSTVGKSLMALCIPKIAVLRQRASGQIFLLTGPPGDDAPTFLYVPGTGERSVIYGPHFAAGGNSSYRFSRWASSAGGLTIRAGADGAASRPTAARAPPWPPRSSAQAVLEHARAQRTSSTPSPSPRTARAS